MEIYFNKETDTVKHIYSYDNMYNFPTFHSDYIKRRKWIAEATVDVFVDANIQDIQGQLSSKVNIIFDQTNTWLKNNCTKRYDLCGRYSIDFESKHDALKYKLSFSGYNSYKKMIIDRYLKYGY